MAYFVRNTGIVVGSSVVPVVPVVPGVVVGGGVLIHRGGERRPTKRDPKITMCYRPNGGKDGLGLLIVKKEWFEDGYFHTNEKTFTCEEDKQVGETIYVISRKCTFPNGIREGHRNPIKEVIEYIDKNGSEMEVENNGTGVWEEIHGFGYVLMIDDGQEGDNYLFYTLEGRKGWFNSNTKKITLKTVFG
jgi:hypothetical protein